MQTSALSRFFGSDLMETGFGNGDDRSQGPGLTWPDRNCREKAKRDRKSQRAQFFWIVTNMLQKRLIRLVSFLLGAVCCRVLFVAEFPLHVVFLFGKSLLPLNKGPVHLGSWWLTRFVWFSVAYFGQNCRTHAESRRTKDSPFPHLEQPKKHSSRTGVFAAEFCGGSIFCFGSLVAGSSRLGNANYRGQCTNDSVFSSCIYSSTPNQQQTMKYR